ncbi:MAG: PIN domain-containing protein [Oscillibacter sp.]|nr:PIN domain-containing protein [Oscillibacter sp.]
MKISFDTNVLLDAIANREGYREAQSLITLVAERRIEGLIAASSITDIYYIARKAIGDERAREAVRNLLRLFEVSCVDDTACLTALDVPMKDYEDAVLAVCSARANADFIATRDREFLEADSPVPTRRPQDLLNLIANGT